MALHALIFDVDGTLADTERDGHRVAFNAAFAAAGLDWQWDVATYGRLLDVTGGKERLRHYVAKRAAARRGPARPRCPHRRAARREDPPVRGRSWRPAHCRCGPASPGCSPTARAAGLRLAIATTTTAENVTALLRHGLSEDAPGWFDVIAAGDVVPRKKPAPDVYLHALEHLGSPTSECLAFEDSENGIRASLGAGVATIVTLNDYTRGQDFAGAVSVLDSLGEPGMPARVISGAAPRLGYVTVDDLRHWSRGAPARV